MLQVSPNCGLFQHWKEVDLWIRHCNKCWVYLFCLGGRQRINVHYPFNSEVFADNCSFPNISLTWIYFVFAKNVYYLYTELRDYWGHLVFGLWPIHLPVSSIYSLTMTHCSLFVTGQFIYPINHIIKGTTLRPPMASLQCSGQFCTLQWPWHVYVRIHSKKMFFSKGNSSR